MHAISSDTHFIASLDGFKSIREDMHAQCEQIQADYQRLIQQLRAYDPSQHAQTEALTQHGHSVRNAIAERIAAWSQRWDQHGLMRAFSEHMADKMVLLVYGKVNSGKSALCNFVADRFAAINPAAK